MDKGHLELYQFAMVRKCDLQKKGYTFREKNKRNATIAQLYYNEAFTVLVGSEDGNIKNFLTTKSQKRKSFFLILSVV